jgi:hypothetical protein
MIVSGSVIAVFQAGITVLATYGVIVRTPRVKTRYGSRCGVR